MEDLTTVITEVLCDVLPSQDDSYGEHKSYVIEPAARKLATAIDAIIDQKVQDALFKMR